MILPLPKIELCSIKTFVTGTYSILGDGGYVVSLLELIKKTHGNMPSCIYVQSFNPELPVDLQVLESDIATLENVNLILGTNLFQLEMLTRLLPKLHDSTRVIDVAAAKGNTETIDLFLNNEPVSERYIVLVGVNPVDNLKHYLMNFTHWLQKQNIQVLVRHPLQEIDSCLLSNALAVLIWNGSMSIHQPFIELCDQSQVDITYLECGFFPQSDYFYFDQNGVNNNSQLNQDDLSWVNASMIDKLADAQNHYCSDILNKHLQPNQFIFVPLQVPTDSNVLNHSRFTRGMQEFIDFIEQQYPNDQVIFKPHPKDRLKDSYRYKTGIVSSENTTLLIANAKLVHGINSSVLYEAVLMGKPVKVEGQCLLATHIHQPKVLLAAMFYRQVSVTNSDFDPAKLRQFSHLKFDQENSLLDLKYRQTHQLNIVNRQGAG